MKKTSILILFLIVILTTSTALGAPPAQETGRAYTVQADDWLSKIADKEYGDPLAYPAIVEATNSKAAEDSSFTVITDPNVVAVGQKLWLPAGAAGPAPAGGEAMTSQPLDAAGIYKVMLPGASSPGLDITLYLNFDHTVRQISDYLNGEAPIVEVGMWQAEGNQVLLTLTGQADRAYDTPATMTLEQSAVGLTQPPVEVGSGTWIYLPFEALAMGQQPPYDPAEAEKMIAANGFTGNYKAFLPAATCCGRDISLALNFDNTAQLTTDYLNGEAPIEQTGVWEATADGRVAVTWAKGQSLMLMQDNGMLVTAPGDEAFGSTGLQLYRFEVIAANSLEAMITGTVSYLQRIALPPQAVITVQLVDVSLADAPAEVISRQITEAAGKQPPFNFALSYKPLKIQSNRSYAVQARIELDGRLMFISTTRNPVLTGDTPNTVDIILEQVTQ
jgi:putative lipoprotein